MPRPSDVDAGRVAAMLELGCPTTIIATRLGCHPRTVRRIRADRGIDHDALWAWGTEHEHDLVWGVLADLGHSTADIAYRVGRSVQAVSQWRKRDRQERALDASESPESWSGDPAHRPQHTST